MNNIMPLPWVANGTRIECPAHPGYRSANFRVADAHSTSAGLANCASAEEAKEHATYIVKACNAYPQLVAALQAVAGINGNFDIDVEKWCGPNEGESRGVKLRACIEHAVFVLKSLTTP